MAVFDVFERPSGWADYNLMPFHPAPQGAELQLPPETWDLFGDFAQGLPLGEFVAAGHGWLNLSCGSDHYVTARIETLTEEPSELDETWQEAIDLPWSTTASAVQLWQLTGGPESPPIRLPASEQYRLRIAARGRHLPMTGLDGAVEDWPVQFWPRPVDDQLRLTHPLPFQRRGTAPTKDYWYSRQPAVDILTVLRTPGSTSITTTLDQLAGEINASRPLTVAGLEAAVADGQIACKP